MIHDNRASWLNAVAAGMAHAPDAMPAQIAAILAHELVHAAVGIKGRAWEAV